MAKMIDAPAFIEQKFRLIPIHEIDDEMQKESCEGWAVEHFQLTRDGAGHTFGAIIFVRDALEG